MSYKFDKRIFRGVCIALVILFFSGWALDGFETRHLYVHCPEGGLACDNPLYEGETVFLDVSEGPQYNPTIEADFTGDNLAEMKHLPPGFSYGKKPNVIIRKAWLFTFLIIVLAFVLNHLIHNRDKKIPKGTFKKLKEAVREAKNERL